MLLDGFEQQKRQEQLLLSIIIIFEIIFISWYILSGRVVAGHDTWQYFSLQYFFMGSAASSGEIPQWIPPLAFGTEATMWYATQGGLLANVALFVAPWFKGADFRPIFSIFMFAEDLLLITGTWLMCKRFFKSPLSMFVVTLSLLSSSVWATQYWFNVRLISALPLVLHIGHKFFETAKVRYLFLFFNLIALQTLGNIPYFIVVFGWAVGMYFILFVSLNFTLVWAVVRKLRMGWPFVVCLVGAGTSLAVAFLTPKLGMQSMVLPGRGDGGGNVGLTEFLTYGSNFSLRNYLELIVRASPNLDWTFYLGFLPILALPFSFRLLCSRRNAPFLCMFLMVGMLSIGGGFSLMNYFGWPLMNMYRHISYLNIFNKFFLVMMAGFGIDVIVAESSEHSKKAKMFAPYFVVFGCTITSIIFYSYWGGEGGWIRALAGSWVDIEPYVKHNVVSSERILLLSIFALFFIFSTLIALVFYLTSASKAHQRSWMMLLITLFVVDVSWYRYDEFEIRSFIPPEEVRQAFILQAPRFVRQWSSSTDLPGEYTENNPSRLRGEPSKHEEARNKVISLVPLNWSKQMWLSEVFVQGSRVNGSLRTQHFSKPLSDLYMSIFSEEQRAQHSTFNQAILSSPFLSRMFGTTVIDRIQFYNDATFCRTPGDIAANFLVPGFNGEKLYLLSPTEDTPSNGKSISRIDLDYNIEKFSSDEVTITVDNFEDTGVWLLYADNWHPWWKAEVNGRPSLIYQANIAFKAVRLDQGFNKVRFYFHVPGIQVAHIFWGLSSLLWIVLIGLCIMRQFQGVWGNLLFLSSLFIAFRYLMHVRASMANSVHFSYVYSFISASLCIFAVSMALFKINVRLIRRAVLVRSIALFSMLAYTSYFTALLVRNDLYLFFFEMLLAFLLTLVLLRAISDDARNSV